MHFRHDWLQKTLHFHWHLHIYTLIYIQPNALLYCVPLYVCTYVTTWQTLSNGKSSLYSLAKAHLLCNLLSDLHFSLSLSARKPKLATWPFLSTEKEREKKKAMKVTPKGASNISMHLCLCVCCCFFIFSASF